MTDVTNKNWPLRMTVLILAIIIAGVVTAFFFKDAITDYFQPKAEIVTTTDSIYTETPPTIDEVVSLRRDIIENMKIDSIYLSMSDIELTAVLMKIGTDATIRGIVTAYKTLQPQLKDVLLGADIAEKLIKEQQTVIQSIDTVPKVSLPTMPSPLNK